MQNHPYKLEGTRTARGGFSGFLLEDGAQIAKIKRPANRVAGVHESYTITWYAERAKSRFIDFCDSISVAEALEALGDRN